MRFQRGVKLDVNLHRLTLVGPALPARLRARGAVGALAGRRAQRGRLWAALPERPVTPLDIHRRRVHRTHRRRRRRAAGAFLWKKVREPPAPHRHLQQRRTAVDDVLRFLGGVVAVLSPCRGCARPHYGCRVTATGGGG